jgi:hypothetical protein
MPSPAERRLLERALRAVGLVSLAVLLVQAWRGESARAPLRVVPAADAARTLAAAPLTSDTLAITTDTALDRVTTAWLAARRDAGAPARWGSAKGIAPSALAIEPSLDPGGGVRALVAATSKSTVRLADSAGVIDSANVNGSGVSFAIATPVGAATARVNGSPARAVASAPARPKAVVILARAGWEPKFIAAALEERGWPAEARFIVRPDTAVVQGSPARFDTARVAVVIALDNSAVAQAGAIAAFVRSGGGLILGPDAAAQSAFAELRAGTPGTRQAPVAISVSAAHPRRALPLVPIEALATGAVALERQGEVIAVAARRLGAGRVLQVGFEDTWRWRMTGPEGAREAHRRWWASLVASASPEPLPQATHSRRGAVEGADAPLARMVADLGAPDPAAATPSGSPESGGGPSWWWGALALVSLLGEWASRRLRGVP